MAKWTVEFYGSVDVEAETEEAAIRAGFDKLLNDGGNNHLFADADPLLTPEQDAAVRTSL